MLLPLDNNSLLTNVSTNNTNICTTVLKLIFKAFRFVSVLNNIIANRVVEVIVRGIIGFWLLL